MVPCPKCGTTYGAGVPTRSDRYLSDTARITNAMDDNTPESPKPSHRSKGSTMTENSTQPETTNSKPAEGPSLAERVATRILATIKPDLDELQARVAALGKENADLRRELANVHNALRGYDGWDGPKLAPSESTASEVDMRMADLHEAQRRICEMAKEIRRLKNAVEVPE